MNSEEKEKIKKIKEAAVRAAYRHQAEAICFNHLHRITKYKNFTGSDMIDLIGGHGTDPLFQSLIQARMRKLAEKGIVFDHSSGTRQTIYVEDKGPYGRTNHPTNLYKMKAA